jgi:DNA-damage-inducible protein D
MNVILLKNTLYSESFEEFRDKLFETELNYLASDLVNYGLNSGEIDLAIQRAINICRTAGLTIKQNFKPVYIYKNSEIISDWRLSALARKLVLLNGNTDNPFVARLQLELLGNF